MKSIITILIMISLFGNIIGSEALNLNAVEFTSQITNVDTNFDVEISEIGEDVIHYIFHNDYQIQIAGEETSITTTSPISYARCSPTVHGLPLKIINTTGIHSNADLYYEICQDIIDPAITSTVTYSPGISNHSFTGYFSFQNSSESKLPAGLYYVEWGNYPTSSGAYIISQNDSKQLEIIYEDDPINWGNLPLSQGTRSISFEFEIIAIIIISFSYLKKINFNY